MHFTLVLLFYVISVSAATFVHEFIDNDLLSGCHFKLGENNYDLCSLILSSDSRMAEDTGFEYEWTGSAAVNRNYTISLGGMGRNRDCPEGTWICLNETLSNFDDTQHETQHEIPKHATVHIPVAGKSRPGSLLVDQGINAVASILGVDNYSATPHLNIFFIGGFWQGKAQYARIDFICDLNGKRGVPFFVEERHDVHIFTWITQHGCPVNHKLPIAEFELESELKDEGRDSVGKLTISFYQALIFSFVVISPMLVALFIVLIRPRSREMLVTYIGVSEGNEKGLYEHTILNTASEGKSRSYGSATPEQNAW
ncbi:hypothetical protein BDZ94DRAFT_1320261 [Collybia nuda]|uniref:Autophagy-related protein 27 n=1 Tax=Collybia nuda TaxID=64659 RepID=A0A9P6CGT5_9AGAR|nr:hypothetical protein BDZ94DRAFT_1320261 [Collybia nuda]